jgi:hypothetical protein
MTHWMLELYCQYALFFQLHYYGVPATPREDYKLEDHLISNMVTETCYVLAAGIVFLLVGLVTRPRENQPQRRHCWLMAACLGAAWCLTRWGIWWASVRIPFDYDELENFLASMILAGIAGVTLSHWRRKIVR